MEPQHQLNELDTVAVKIEYDENGLDEACCGQVEDSCNKLTLPEGTIPLGDWHVLQNSNSLSDFEQDDKPKRCEKCGQVFEVALDLAGHDCAGIEGACQSEQHNQVPQIPQARMLNPKGDLFECTKCRLLFQAVDELKCHKCLGYLNEAEREERKRNRIVKVGGQRLAATKAKRKLHKIVASLEGNNRDEENITADGVASLPEADIRHPRKSLGKPGRPRGRPPKSSGPKLVVSHQTSLQRDGSIIKRRGRPLKLKGEIVQPENPYPEEHISVPNLHEESHRSLDAVRPVSASVDSGPDNPVDDRESTKEDNDSIPLCDSGVSASEEPLLEDKAKPLKKRKQRVSKDTLPLKSEKIPLPKSKEGKGEKKIRCPPTKIAKDDLICRFCGKACRKPYELRVHERLHTNERPFSCPQCPKRYTSGSCLNKHIQYTHVGNNLKCKECDVKFGTKELLKEHCDTMGHSIQWPYQCDLCDKSYHKRRQLENHKLTHEGIKPHKCSICEAAFATKASLVLHTYTHTGDRPFECDQCGIRFLTRYLLNTHKMNHTGERPHLCDFCGKGFKLAAQLRNHREVHRKDKPFICELCGKKFKWRYNMLEHAKCHGESVKQKEARFFCAICGKGYYHRSGLDYHERTHTGERPYKCARCNKKFRHNAHLQKHLARLHNLSMTLKPLTDDPGARTFREDEGSKAYGCEQCSKRFKHQTTLEKHMRTYHGVCMSYQAQEPEPPVANTTQEVEEDEGDAGRVLDHSEALLDFSMNNKPEDLTQGGHIDIALAQPLSTQPLSYQIPEIQHSLNPAYPQSSVMRAAPSNAYDQRQAAYSDYFSMMNLSTSAPVLIGFPPGFIQSSQYNHRPVSGSDDSHLN